MNIISAANRRSTETNSQTSAKGSHKVLFNFHSAWKST